MESVAKIYPIIKKVSGKTVDVLKKIYPIFSLIIVLLIYVSIFSANKIYPFGDLSIAWCDMSQQTIPLLCSFKDVLSGDRSLWLSLENAGGMNFFGVYFFNLSSPFTYLILFFEKSQMDVAVNLMVVLKFAVAALTFTLWLKIEIKNVHPIVAISAGVIYAFSGWAMMYYQILSWLDTLYVFPILLIGLKNLSEGKSPIIYILSLFSCILFHFYLGWAIVIFVCLYGSIKVLSIKENRGGYAKTFLISSAISALLSIIVIIPAFLQYLKSMRTGNIFEELAQTALVPPITTSHPTFFSLAMLFPFIIMCVKNKGFDVLEGLFVLTVVPIFLEPVASAWQTYNYMSFPTRYGFITIAIGLTLAVKGITSLCDRVDDKVGNYKVQIAKIIISIISIAVVICFAVFSKNYYTENKDDLTRYSSRLWGNEASYKGLIAYYLLPTVIFSLVSLCLHFNVIYKYGFFVALATITLFEGIFSANVYMVAPSNVSANFNRAIQLENLIEDDEFYRLKVQDKIFDVNLTGAMGYNSLAHYTSLTRESYMMSMKQLGYSSYWMEVNSNGGTTFTDALVRHKYIVNRSKSKAEYNTEELSIVKNEILFPTAFIIPKTGNNEGDVTLERWQIQDSLFTRLTGKTGLYKEYEHRILSNVIDNSASGKAKTDFKLKSGVTSGSIKYVIDVVGLQDLYFDCFDVYSNALKEHTYEAVRSVSISGSNGRTLYTYPTQSKNGVLWLGTFSDCTVTVTVTLQKDIYANSFGVFSVDKQLLKDAVNGVIGGDFNLVNDKLEGEITAKEGDALFTSLAYDEGYKVKINGKSAKTFSVNGFLAIELKDGANSVKVDFRPRGLILGVVAFLLGVAALVCYLKFRKSVDEFIKFDNLFIIALVCIGAVVIIAIYLMPICVSAVGLIR